MRRKTKPHANDKVINNICANNFVAKRKDTIHEKCREYWFNQKSMSVSMLDYVKDFVPNATEEEIEAAVHYLFDNHSEGL